jgi:outer membrane protein assembly factor BamB
LKQVEDQVAEARKRFADTEQQRKQAPERMTELAAMEQAGNLASALAGYRMIAGLGHETASPAAKEGVGRLEPKEQALAANLTTASELISRDLAKADAALLALEAGAKAWGREADVKKKRAEIATRARDAAAAYQTLGATPTTDALAAFIAAHPASAQVAQAKARLDLLTQSQRSRDEQMTAWRAAMQAEQTEQAWRIARNMFAGGGTVPAELRLPIRIETAPAGAQVMLAGQPAGTTPCVIAVRPEQATHDVQLTMDGWQPTTKKVGELAGEWRWQAAMARATRWQVNLGKPIGFLMVLPDGGVLALAGEVLHRLSKEGKPLWRTSVATVDDLSDIERFRLAHQPLVQGDGSLVFGLPNKDVGLISGKGTIDARFASVEAVRGQPVTYSNDLLGGQARLAYAAEGLYVGDVGQAMTRIPLSSAALSGPLVYPKGPDRLLVVATVQGQFVAVEESTKKRLWQFDLQATEIGQLLPLGTDGACAVLDGSRISAWRITPTGASLRWNTALPGPAVGDAMIAGNQIWIAAGNGLVRLTAEGVATTLPLPSTATTSVAAGGDLAAVGVRSGQVVVFRQGTALWSSRCDAPPSAVACTGDVVVVGLADGTLATYSP